MNFHRIFPIKRKWLPFLAAGIVAAAFSLAVDTRYALAQNSEKELFLVAQKAFEDGFYDVAIRYILQLQEQYPQTEKRVESNLLLGQCYFFKSQYLKAYDIFHELLAYPEFKDATLFWLGETYLKGGDTKQAEKQYRQIIDVYPQSIYAPQAYYSLGWIYFEQNQFPEAQKTFEQFIQRFPDHQLKGDAVFKLGEVKYNLQAYEKAIDHFVGYIFDYPQSTRQAEAYFYIGESYYYLKDYLRAVTYYAKAAETAYDNKLILLAKVSLGWSYLRLEKLTLAQRYFEEAYALAKEKNILSDDVLLGQATLYSQMKEYPKAMEAYVELIAAFPDSPRAAEAHLGRANIYYLTGDYPQAVESYQKIIDMFRGGPEASEILEKAYFGLAWSYLKLGNIDASIRSFETIKDRTESKTVKTSALTQIGDAYQDHGELEKAVDVYDTILKDYAEGPYTDYVQYRQGIALLKMENIKAATLSFQGLRANFPRSSYLHDAQYYLAVAHFKKGDWAQTKDEIAQFISSLPPDNEYMAEALYILALSCFNLHEYDDALKSFQRIVKDYPEQSAMIRNCELHIARCHDKKGGTQEALKQFQELVERYPQSQTAQEALLELGDHSLESSDFDAAIAYYRRFIEEFPGSEKRYMVYYEMGQSYQAKGELDGAVNAFKEVDDPKQGELYAKARLAIADIFSRKLDSEKAVETYQNIIAASPEFRRDAYDKIAEVYQKDKEYEKAIEAYQKAISSPKGFGGLREAQLQFHIADTYELLNRRDQAVEEYLKLPYLYANETEWVVKSYLRVARIFEDEERWAQAQTIYGKIIPYDTDERKFAQERLEWIEEHINPRQ